MGTVVTMRIVHNRSGAEEALAGAFHWFHEIEQRCSRFSAESELLQLTAQVGVAVPVSAILYEAVRFAVAVAEQTAGVFDPAVGGRMERRGFNREYRTGAIVSSAHEPEADVSYRDIELGPEKRTVLLRRPLTLDLGAVAKGLAVDMAALELAEFRDFSIDAGGDLYMGGVNPLGEPWKVGIRHPRSEDQLFETLRVSDRAVCTSGDYERGRHILDGRTGAAVQAVASATVVAPGAMLADALATAAFAAGPAAGIDLLNFAGVEGLIVTPALQRFETSGFFRLTEPHAA